MDELVEQLRREHEADPQDQTKRKRFRAALKRSNPTHFAVLSCIHSNLEALEAVFADIDRRGITDVICLGDIIGFGPNPVECIDLVMERCRVTLRGNHDESVCQDLRDFNRRAQAAIEWSEKKLRPGLFSAPRKRRRWMFLNEAPEKHEEDGFLFVHGSPRDPVHEYILPHELQFGPSPKMDEIFSAFERALFVGHTHHPGVIVEAPKADAPCDSLEKIGDDLWHKPEDLGHCWGLASSQKPIINVGSVGHLNNNSTWACYVEVLGDVVFWHRIEYDYEKTCSKIESIPELDNFLAMRLRNGV